MNSLRVAWYRWCDRELDRPVVLPEREFIEAGAWNAWVGSTGERLAAKALWRAGCSVIYRNFQPRNGGEIDLVCRDGEILVFVEVKTRTSERFGRPGDAVDRGKRNLIVKGANAWLRALDYPEVLYRFDVVEVVLLEGEKPDIRLIREAFPNPQVGLGM